MEELHIKLFNLIDWQVISYSQEAWRLSLVTIVYQLPQVWQRGEQTCTRNGKVEEEQSQQGEKKQGKKERKPPNWYKIQMDKFDWGYIS